MVSMFLDKGGFFQASILCRNGYLVLFTYEVVHVITYGLFVSV